MNILFVHQNYPGQYVHISKALAANPRNRVVGIGEAKTRPALGYPVVTYPSPKFTSPQTHHYLKGFEGQVRRGQHVFRVCRELKRQGFYPDIICAHPAWGETLFLRDAFPKAKILIYCEFFYQTEGSDMRFDPEFPCTLDSELHLRIKNSTQLHALNDCDAGQSPTRWQWQQYPALHRDRISILHEGVDTSIVGPRPEATFDPGPGKPVLTKADKVITYVSRNLEPYRGFHTFMRTIPLIQERHPDAHIVIIGGDEVSYGRRLKGQTYREKYLAEVDMDLTKVHFMGRIPYQQYLSALHVSTCHVYLTYPFVLSWSCIEAMAAGCALVGSRTAPVQEVVEDTVNGLLVDFFSPQDIADKVGQIVTNPKDFQQMRNNARSTMVDHYDLRTQILPAQIRVLENLRIKG